MSKSDYECKYTDPRTGKSMTATSIPGMPEVNVRIIEMPSRLLKTEIEITQADGRHCWKSLATITPAIWDMMEASQFLDSANETTVQVTRMGDSKFKEAFTGEWRKWVVEEAGFEEDSLDVPKWVIRDPKVENLVSTVVGEPTEVRAITGTPRCVYHWKEIFVVPGDFFRLPEDFLDEAWAPAVKGQGVESGRYWARGGLVRSGVARLGCLLFLVLDRRCILLPSLYADATLISA